MGLDITAYQNVERIGDPDYDDAQDDHRNLYVGQLAAERAAPLTMGLYRVSGINQHFRAGGYGVYNSWRAWLCRVMLGVKPSVVRRNKDDYAGREFVELIDFSDSEGTIGPVVSAKLAADFAEHRPKAAANPGEDGKWNLQRYDDWHAAFALAANTGAVLFH